MSATSRSVRAVALPVAPRFRRVTAVGVRPFGTISLFLLATGVLGLTSLCYLSQSGQITAAAYRVQALNTELATAQNTTSQLRTEIAQLQSPVTIMQAAQKYGMSLPNDPSSVRVVLVPGQVVTKRVPVGLAPRPVVRLRLATTSSAFSGLWQQFWVMLYSVMH